MEVRQKGLKNSEKNVTVLTNLEQICKDKFIGLNSKPKSTQHLLARALKNIRFEPGWCCCLFKIV